MFSILGSKILNILTSWIYLFWFPIKKVNLGTQYTMVDLNFDLNLWNCSFGWEQVIKHIFFLCGRPNLHTNYTIINIQNKYLKECLTNQLIYPRTPA